MLFAPFRGVPSSLISQPSTLIPLSIPRIPFVQSGIIQLAYPAEFVLERCLLVVFLLAFDVGHHRIHMAVAHAERTISVLPTKMMERIGVLLVDPSRGARFDGTHDVRQIHLFPQEEQYVDMVGGAAHLDGGTPVVVEYLGHVGVNFGQVLFGYGLGSAFGGEHEVNI